MNEFTLINKYLKPLSLKNPGALKLSDDIFFNPKKKFAISIDTFVEGLHFLDPSNPDKFLRKILRASLSDLYCKGIKPNTYFLSFALNSKLAKPSWLKKIKNILNKEQAKFKVTLGGGDTTYSSKLVITVATLGYIKKRPILRNNCKLNDDIYVTGNIGDSYLGLNVIKKKFNFGKFNNFLKKKYYVPHLPIKISPYLNRLATSSIDISDGLTLDLQHLCADSRYGALINLNLLPLSAICKLLLKRKKIQIKDVFSRGDDYQILFTSNSKNRSKIIFLSKKLKTKITKIGFIKKEKNIVIKHNKVELKLNLKKMGYIHNF